MLPGIDGMEVCRQLRTFSDAYVIMLTGRSDEIDRVIGLEVGADDYLTKPFSPRELQARVKAMLRRPRSTQDVSSARSLTVGPLHIDVAGREVRLDGLALTKIEFDLLATLASEPGVVFSRARLRAEVWGSDWFGDDHVVDVHIANLRKKVHVTSPARELIRTVRGVGYRLGAED
jgi:DNA-binding response OmpR family regulator